VERRRGDTGMHEDRFLFAEKLIILINNLFEKN